MDIDKLTERYYKLAVTHYGLDPETKLPIKPEFENGDLVDFYGKKAKYLAPAVWVDARNPQALIHFLDIPVRDKAYSIVPECQLKLIRKKDGDEVSDQT